MVRVGNRNPIISPSSTMIKITEYGEERTIGEKDILR